MRYRIRRIGAGGSAWALVVNGRIVFEGTRGWCEEEAVRRYGLTAVQARAAARGVLHVAVVRYWGEADAARRRREGDAATPWLSPCQFAAADCFQADDLNAELNAAGERFVDDFGDRAVCGAAD